MFYYKSKISENIRETEEGYLICYNVPIARTGYMEYLASEIGEAGNDVIDVLRISKEVFSKKSIASFENKPFTYEHPNEDVNSENFEDYLKGVVINVRRGENSNKNFLIADIVIYDKETSEEILEGKREISCGYTCLYEINSEGEYIQTEIRGNHIALVDQGRAGSRVAIKDKKIFGGKKMKKQSKNKSFWDIFKNKVRDAEPEELEKMEEIIEEVREEDEETKDEDMETMLRRIVREELQSKNKDENPMELLEEIIEEVEETTDGEVDDEEITDEEDEEKATTDSKILRKLKPVIAKLPKTQQRIIVDSLRGILKGNKKTNKNGYKNLINLTNSRDNKFPKDISKHLNKIKNNFNPHNKAK